MTPPKNEIVINPEKVLELASHIMTSLSNCSLYSQDHPAVLHLAGKAVRVLDDLYSDDTIIFIVLGDRLIINNIPFPEKSIHLNNLTKKLRRKGIEKIVIKKGITPEEMKTFISEIASSEKISSTYQHISAGIVDVRLKSEGENVQAIMDGNVARVRDIHQGLSRFKTLDMVGLEDVVISFISTLRREANVLRVLSPIKSYSEYTYAHNTNVSVLSIFQAESVGLKGEILHEVGLAGLLHDIGKIYISKEVLEKQGKLDSAEWAEIKKHPLYGAMHLSTLADVPALAVVVAFEHHMKFDGTGYPETKRRGKKQHIISQIVALSDFFDALRTERTYRKALDVPVIAGLIKEATGKDFNPLLAENFILALKKIKAL